MAGEDKRERERERSPVEVLCEMVQTVRENFRNEKNKLMNNLRLALEKMTTDIKNSKLRRVKSKKNGLLRNGTNLTRNLNLGSLSA